MSWQPKRRASDSQGAEDPAASCEPSRKPPPDPPPTSEAGLGPERIAVDAAFRSDAAVRTAVTENLKPLEVESAAVTTRVNRAFADFHASSLPAGELQRRNYIKRGADITEVTDKVIESGLQQFRDTEVTPAITFRGRANLPNPISGTDARLDTVDLGTLVRVIGAKSRGSSIIGQAAVAPCRVETHAEALINAIDGAAPPAVVTERTTEAGTGSNGSDGSDGGGQFVQGAVQRQMHSATSPETKLEYGTIPTIPNTAGNDAVQGRILDTFELRPGASDVTSYHDFHTLQIAFEHVWTQIFDGELEALGRDLYHHYVQLKDFSGSTGGDLSVSTLADLKRLMDEVRRLSERVDQQMPSDLRGDTGSGGAKSAGDHTDDIKIGVGVATGGVSLLIEWAIEEFSKIGRKPVLAWNSFPGPWPPRFDRIERSIAPGAAPKNTVEIALRTDPGSHLKIVELEPFDQATKTFVHGPGISNAGNVPDVKVLVPTSLLTTSVLEFASEESPGINLGRYLLADLSQNIPDGSRITFHWKDH